MTLPDAPGMTDLMISPEAIAAMELPDTTVYRCAGGCDRVVSSSPALCLSCAAHPAAPDAPGVGLVGDET